MSDKSYKIFFVEWLLVLVAIFLTFLLVAISAYFVFENIYKGKIYPGLNMGQTNLSGLTTDEAKKQINQKIAAIHQNGILFYYNDTYTTFQPTITSAETDLSYDIISFDVENTVGQIYLIGREGGFMKRLGEKINLLLYGRGITLKYGLNVNEIKKILTDNFSQYEIPGENAGLKYENSKFQIKDESIGKTIDYDSGIVQLQKDLSVLNLRPITLNSHIDNPKISKSECSGMIDQAEEMMKLVPITLKYDEYSWETESDEFGKWLMVKKNNDNKISLALDYVAIKDYLDKNISPEINKPPVDAKFEHVDGRVVEFQASQAGIALDIDASIQNLERTLFNASSTVELVVKADESKIKTQDVNNLGINEIIGIGQSNFAGSPVNRRHNIKTGADSLHGLLIKPDEEFSLIGALGEIEAETGYLPELVIKGNKTIPEYGGGLCQIGTTVFRAALDSGLDITMRRNHSYRVSYYEPAGTDATIYNPWPDLRFINDTGKHILIQTDIEGDELYFYFWGTADGRKASRTEPTIFNIAKPGPTKYIETLDLAPGIKKCTEHAHNGADAYFDYFVEYANGERKEERFKSHYVPWQEVCLIGVEKLSTETDETKTATSTEEKTIE